MATQRRRLPSYLNAQISLLCAASLLRTEPPLDDQNGGSARGYQELFASLAAGQTGYSPAGQVTGTVYLYVAALIANVLICRMSGILQDFYGKPLIGRLAGRWPPA
jgi:hypothetical protein